MFNFFVRRRRRPRAHDQEEYRHYLLHKEMARAIIIERLKFFGAVYGYSWNRVAIRRQKRRWGSCSSRGNLNFNYKLLFLPEHLRDYIIIHEICHLAEMNHGPAFWHKVSVCCPKYRECVQELRVFEKSTQLKAARLSLDSDLL